MNCLNSSFNCQIIYIYYCVFLILYSHCQFTLSICTVMRTEFPGYSADCVTNQFRNAYRFYARVIMYFVFLVLFHFILVDLHILKRDNERYCAVSLFCCIEENCRERQCTAPVIH